MVNLCQLCCSDFPVGKRPFKAGLQGKPEDHWRSRNQKSHKLDPKKTSNLPGFTGESFQELQWLHPGPKVAAVAVTNDHWHHRPPGRNCGPESRCFGTKSKPTAIALPSGPSGKIWMTALAVIKARTALRQWWL